MTTLIPKFDLKDGGATPTGAVNRPINEKLAETVSVKDFGAVGDGVADDTTAIQAAIDSGATQINFPEGSYKVTSSLIITSATAAKKFVGIGVVTITLNTATQNSVFEVQTGTQLFSFENLKLVSSGTKADAYATYGILAISSSYCYFNNINTSNFSGAGIELRACVYAGFTNFIANSCLYGLSLQKVSTSPCVAIDINRAYITGCTRGFTLDSCTDVIANGMVFEYCGSTTTSDAALQLLSTTIVMDYPYFEANYRDIVSVDGVATIRNTFGYGTGTAASSITYVGVPFDERGWNVSYAYNTTMARLNADSVTNRDLIIGTNLTVPVAGGSVVFGKETMLEQSGTLTSGSWTAAYIIPNNELYGTNTQKAFYEYVCYAGTADLSTGFDAGTIYNGTLRSYSGTTPAWLRLNVATIEMNVTSSSYGLNYKVELRRIYPT